MKMKVTPEGRPGVYTVGVKDLAEWLDDYFKTHESIHNYIANDNTPMVMGADWHRKDFDVHLVGDVMWAVATRTDGTFAGHRLICIDSNNPMRHMRYIFDIGKVTEDDLDVVGEAEEMERKVFDDDEGQLGAAIYIKGDQIIIHFGKSIKWLSLGKDDAEAMIKELQERVAKL